jgi:shikimate kinase
MTKSVKVESGSAITVLNAIRSTHGSAIGINIPISVEINNAEQLTITTNPMEIGDELILECITSFQEYNDVTVDDLHITTNSPLPAQRGLKTSSSVSMATLKALATFFEMELTVSELVSLSAQASLRCGVSLTGAMDDAYASFCGGLSLTQNFDQQLISLKPYISNDTVVLLIPKKSTSKNEVMQILEGIDPRLLKRALKSLRKGNIIEAIEYNTKAYSPLLDKKHVQLQDLRAQDTLVVGINGAGPSLFAICQHHQVKVFKKYVKDTYPEYSVRLASFKALSCKGV